MLAGKSVRFAGKSARDPEAFLPQGSLVCDVVGKRTNAARHLFFGMVLLPIWGEHVMVRSVPTQVGARHRDL